MPSWRQLATGSRKCDVDGGVAEIMNKIPLFLPTASRGLPRATAFPSHCIVSSYSMNGNCNQMKRFGTSWVMSLPLQVTCMGGCTAGKRITKRKPRIGFSSSLALEREQLQNAPNIARHVAAKSHLSFPRKDFIFYMSFFITYIIIYIYIFIWYIYM